MAAPLFAEKVRRTTAFLQLQKRLFHVFFIDVTGVLCYTMKKNTYIKEEQNTGRGESE